MGQVGAESNLDNMNRLRRPRHREGYGSKNGSAARRKLARR